MKTRRVVIALLIVALVAGCGPTRILPEFSYHVSESNEGHMRWSEWHAVGDTKWLWTAEFVTDEGDSCIVTVMDYSQVSVACPTVAP